MAFRVEEKDVAMDVRASSIIQMNKVISKKIFLYQLLFPRGGGGRGEAGRTEANPTIISTPMNHCHNI